MKLYYYSENGLQFGPFTIEELAIKNLKKETLVWYEGLDDWVSACKVDELKSILASTPPSLPKTLKSDETKYKEETLKNSNYGYQKEYKAIIVGFLFGCIIFCPNIDILSPKAIK